LPFQTIITNLQHQSSHLDMPRRRRPARPGALADLAPKRILAQIVILQLLYYAVAAALILFTTLVAGRDVTADSLLSWRTVRSDVTTGWMLGLCWMMDSMIWCVTDASLQPAAC